MNVPDELRPIVSELERSWGVVTPNIAAGLDVARSRGYPITVLALLLVYSIHGAIEVYLRDERLTIHQELAKLRAKERDGTA